MPKTQKKFYLILSILLALSFGIKAFASLSLNTNNITSDGSLTLTNSGGILTLPTTLGTSGQFLQTNGAGVTSWATVTSGTGTGGTWGSITGTLSSQTDLQSALDAKQTTLAFTPENIANKATDFSIVNNTLYPTVQAAKTYADGLVAGLLDYRGGFDAGSGAYPTTGGSGSGGAVLKGNTYVINTQGILGGNPIQVGDSIIANIDNPGQLAANWNTLNTNISYVPENQANKVTTISGASTDTQYPSAKLLFDSLKTIQPLCSTTVTTNCVVNTGTTGNVVLGTGLPVGWTNIAAWGDSLTAGTGATTATAYPSDLGNMTGKIVFNGGVGSDTSTQIATRFLADSTHRNWYTIIWAGRNNFSNQATVLADIASMVAALPVPKRFLVLGVINATTELSGSSGYNQIVALNDALAAAYPANYLDIRSYIVSQFDSGIPQDVIDHGNDVSPSSLRFDTVHLNPAGYTLVANRIAAFFAANPDFVPRMNDIQIALANGNPIGTASPGIGAFASVASPVYYGTTPATSLNTAGNGNWQTNTSILCQVDGSCNLGFSSSLQRFSWVYLKAGLGLGTLAITPTGDASSLQTNGKWVPQFDNTYDLGFSATLQRWRNLYLTGAVYVGGSAGISSVKTIKGSDGNNCTLTITGGIITATTCP